MKYAAMLLVLISVQVSQASWYVTCRERGQTNVTGDTHIFELVSIELGEDSELARKVAEKLPDACGKIQFSNAGIRSTDSEDKVKHSFDNYNSYLTLIRYINGRNEKALKLLEDLDE